MPDIFTDPDLYGALVLEVHVGVHDHNKWFEILACRESEAGNKVECEGGNCTFSGQI
jgi:hypothetical protein